MDETNPQKMQFGVAWRALRRLIADPEDTAQVFQITRAMAGPSVEKGFNRFKATSEGRQILDAEIDLLDTLRDREKLRTLRPDSLGRHYLAFMEQENLSADGLVEASEDGEQWANADMARYGQRLRDQHDLWHTLTRYGRDELGELCLLAFTYAQTQNRGIGLIVLMGMLQLRKTYGNGVYRAARRGYRDGRRAAWLPGVAWEQMMARPIDEVRASLGVPEPISYQALKETFAAA